MDKKNIKWFFIGTAIFAVGILSYHQLTRKKPKKPSQKIKTQQTERLSTSKSVYQQYYFDKQSVRDKLLLQFSQQSPIIENIFTYSPMLIKDDFVKYTRQMRKRRRLIRKHNQQAYISIILTYFQDIQKLLQMSRQELIEALQINQSYYQTLVNQYDLVDDIRHLQKKSQGILMQIMKQSSSKRQLSIQTLQKILNQQIDWMKKRLYVQFHQRLQREELDQDDILHVIDSLLDDIIYQKYGYQRQHIQTKIAQLKYNVSQRQKYRTIMESEIGNFKLDTSFDRGNQLIEIQGTGSFVQILQQKIQNKQQIVNK